MDNQDLKIFIGNKGDNAASIARAVTHDPVLLAEIFKGLDSTETRVKYKSIKILSLLSQQTPALLYPYFDVFVDLLDSPKSIFKWNALDILANLVAVDQDGKFDSLFSQYYCCLKEGSLITAGHVVESSPVIVKHRPAWEPRITQALLSAETIPLPTEECRCILAGKVILAFGQYASQSKNSGEMLDFAKKQLNSSRAATQKKAEQFIKKYSGEIAR